MTERHVDGDALWGDVTAALDLDAHERAILAEACRTLDRLHLLDAAIRRAPLVDADGRPTPLLAAAQAAQITFVRLIASLRLPADLDAASPRPQRRGAARGVYARPRVLRGTA